MNKKIAFPWGDVFDKLAEIDKPNINIYGVPCGGMILTAFLKNASAVHRPDLADIILDDLVDSGQTRAFYVNQYPAIPFHTLYIKKDPSDWFTFPWETEHPGKNNIQHNIIRVLQYIGEQPNREGLLETPNRVVQMFAEIYSGYYINPKDIFTVFDAEEHDQIILLRDFEIYSMCEHHMLPFFGKCHVAYIPNEKIVGISKLARLVDIYSKRLQIQERICQQVTNDLIQYLNPKGAACIIEATHLCMRMRGVNKQNSIMTTSSMKGVFLEDQSAKSELLQLVRK